MSRPHGTWRRINEIFEQALALPLDEREVFLTAQCGETGDERDQVEFLLESDAEAGASSFLEKHLDKGEDSEALPREGSRLGPYRILRELGSGGMGTVYLASRDDTVFERRVAIKLIRQGRTTADALRRMRIERQILASLEHPGIAALYDGGATPNGSPYFVMEYVDGIRIDAYCDQQRKNPRERVDLFLSVCEAVEFAHRNLIVHRDLKPSNILVTGAGTAKLLDFGVAKLLNPNLSRGEIEATQAWMRVLTPGYASPEQVLGWPVTTASDVYSLGVLLFKLLTGRLPFQPEEERILPDEQLFEREAPTASRVVRHGKSDKNVNHHCQAIGWRHEQIADQLMGDLDSIVAKALRGPSDLRYGTVGEFREDLRRYRCDLPVTARQGRFRYQAGKFLRRHTLAVSMTPPNWWHRSTDWRALIAAGGITIRRTQLLRKLWSSPDVGMANTAPRPDSP